MFPIVFQLVAFFIPLSGTLLPLIYKQSVYYAKKPPEGGLYYTKFLRYGKQQDDTFAAAFHPCKSS